jgi:hypothetical protein
MEKVYFGKFLKLYIILTAFLLMLSFSPKTTAAPDENSSLGFTVGPPVVEYTAEKGQTINGIVRVNDYSPAPITLYPQVADFTAKDETGQPAFFESNPNRKYSLSTWIKFSAEPLKFGIGELKAIQYQIVVPADAEPGGHYGVFFFSTKSPNNVKEGEAKVVANMKVGQLILVTVKGDIKEKGVVETFKTKHLFNWFPQVQYSNEKLFKITSNIDLITRLKNVGNVHFKPKGKIEIKNVFGQKKAELTFNEKKGNVLPDSIRLFDNVWKAKWWNMGIYKANLDLAYGVNNNGISDSYTFFIVPWWLLVILVLIIWFVARKIRKRNKK